MAQVLLLAALLTSVSENVEGWQLERDPAVACFVGDSRWCKAALSGSGIRPRIKRMRHLEGLRLHRGLSAVLV